MGIVRKPKEWDETCSQCRGSGTVHKRERFSLMTPDEQRVLGLDLTTIDPKHDPPADAAALLEPVMATIETKFGFDQRVTQAARSHLTRAYQARGVDPRAVPPPAVGGGGAGGGGG